MKKALRIVSSLFILLSLSCGGTQNNGLTMTIIPNQPVAIPYGTTTVLGTSVTAPYFVVNSINLTWSGANSLEVVAIIMQSPVSTSTTTTTTTTAPSVTCGISGDQLAASYATYNNNGNVIIPTGVTATSGPMPCSGFTLPTPLPQTLSIPVQIQVVGVIVDASGNPTGRVTQTQNITVE